MKHWMNKLNKEERSHYMTYICSKEGMRENLNHKNDKGQTICRDCVHIAHKLGWYDELTKEDTE